MESTLKEEILDKFLQLSESISIIEDRCKNIQNVDDFLLSPWGMTVLDACIMRIQVIGETIKAIDDKTQRSFSKIIHKFHGQKLLDSEILFPMNMPTLTMRLYG